MERQGAAACAACSTPSPAYDLMNDLMSGGAHRLWKRFALSCTRLRPGQRALDVAGGTGDLCVGVRKQVGNLPAWWCSPTSMPRCWRGP